MAFTYESTETIDPAALRDIVSAEGSATISQGMVVTGTYGAATRPAAVSDAPIAIARQDIAAGTRGRAAVRGLIPVLAGTGGFTAGDRLMPEAATGKLITWTASTGSNASIVGVAHQTVAANALGLAEINCTGALGQG